MISKFYLDILGLIAILKVIVGDGDLSAPNSMPSREAYRNPKLRSSTLNCQPVSLPLASMNFQTPYNEANSEFNAFRKSGVNAVLPESDTTPLQNQQEAYRLPSERDLCDDPALRKRPTSILKNSPSRTITKPMHASTPLTTVESQHQTKPNRVMFSPTNEILRYEVDHTELYPNKSLDQKKRTFMPTFLSNTTAPYVLLMYLQLLFNVILALIIIYLIYVFISTIRIDTRHKMEIATTDALRQISLCSREYYRNKCSSSSRAPALEMPCMEWEKCMNRDPEKIGKSLVTAQTFGEIINEFLKPISWKLIILCNILIFGSFIATNVLLSSLRKGESVKRLEGLKDISTLEERLREAEKEIRELRQTNAELQKQTPTFFSLHELELMNDSVGYSPLVAKMRRGL